MRRLSAFSISAMALLAMGAAGGGQEVSPRGRLTLEQPAPEITVTTVEGKPTSLGGLRSAAPKKIIVLQFGSITDPIFRLHMPVVEKMAAKNTEKAVFVIVYQKEAHAADSADPLEVNENEGFNLAEPTLLAERQKLAGQAMERLHITSQTMVVDAWNNASSLRYGSYANMTFIVDAKGNLQAGYPFMDAAKVQSAIDLLAQEKPLPAELKGDTQKSGPAALDFAGAAMDMTGGRGPASIAAVLEHVTLTTAQRQAVLAAVAGYMADVQEFRVARGGGGAAAAARAGVAAPARGVVTPAELQAAVTTLRASAEKLKGVIRQNMSAKDAEGLYEVLDALTPAQRLFGGQ